jgi:hypothetical protein
MGVHRPRPTDQPRPEPSPRADDVGRSILAMAAAELKPKLAESAYMIAVTPPGESDAKQALEIGYAILLNKPIVVVIPAGREVNAGLIRHADKVIRMRNPIDSEAGTQELMAAIGSFHAAQGLEPEGQVEVMEFDPVARLGHDFGEGGDTCFRCGLLHSTVLATGTHCAGGQPS